MEKKKRNFPKISLAFFLFFNFATFIHAQDPITHVNNELDLQTDITSTFVIDSRLEAYEIDFPINVSNGQLIIEPGVTLAFTASGTIRIANGSLIIRGNSSHNVFFKPIDAQSSPIEFQNASVDINYLNMEFYALLSINSSVVRINNSRLSISNGISLFNCETFVSNTNIASLSNSIAASYGDLTLSNSSLNSTTNSGLSLTFMRGLFEDLSIDSGDYCVKVFGSYQLIFNKFKLKNVNSNGFDQEDAGYSFSQASYRFNSSYLTMVGHIDYEINVRLFNSAIKNAPLKLTFHESVLRYIYIYTINNVTLEIQNSTVTYSSDINTRSGADELIVNIQNTNIKSIYSYNIISSFDFAMINSVNSYIYFDLSSYSAKYNLSLVNNLFRGEVLLECAEYRNLNQAEFISNQIDEQIQLDHCFNVVFRRNILKKTTCPISSYPLVYNSANFSSLKLVDAKFNYWNSLDELEVFNKNCYLYSINQNYIEMYPVTDNSFNQLNLTEPLDYINPADNSTRGGYMNKNVTFN